jgi:hypothetical protein
MPPRLSARLFYFKKCRHACQQGFFILKNAATLVSKTFKGRGK